MQGQGVFITGTDTGVGKTLVCAALLSVLRARGKDAVPMKAVQTGARSRNGRWSSPDLDFCLACAGLRPDPEEYVRMAPCCFAKACSPHLAARLAGRRIAFDHIITCFQALRARHAMVIVEGAGGVFAPVQGRRTMLDLMVALDLPVVVAARSGLGTVNHTLLTINALRRARAHVLGVVFDAAAPGGPAYIERDNITTVTRLGAVRVLGRMPFIPNIDALSGASFRRAATAGLAPAAVWMKLLKAPSP